MVSQRLLAISVRLVTLCAAAAFAVLAPHAAHSASMVRNPTVRQDSGLLGRVRSDAESIRIVDAGVVVGDSGYPTLRLRLRNSSSEQVVGIHFDIEGADPNTALGYSEVGAELGRDREGFGPNTEILIDVQNADADDLVTISAVLFASGHGEGAKAEVRELRKGFDQRKHAKRMAGVPSDAPN